MSRHQIFVNERHILRILHHHTRTITITTPAIMTAAGLCVGWAPATAGVYVATVGDSDADAIVGMQVVA